MATSSAPRSDERHDPAPGSARGTRLLDALTHAQEAALGAAAAQAARARELAAAHTERARALAREQAARAEAALRARFGGYDTSHSAAREKSIRLARLRGLFRLLDARGRGTVPIDELEEVFGAADLIEARTMVGQCAYDADTDGNGALDFNEFQTVMDELEKYTSPSVAAGTTAPHISGSFVFGTEGGSLPLRDVVFRTFEDPMFSQLARVIAIVLGSAVLLAVLVFVLQSDPAWAAYEPLFLVLEGVCATVFIVDYVVRVLTCPNLRAFLFAPFNIIDLLTIAPYLLDEINEAFHPKGGYGGAIRILRVFRVFRIFRVTKYIPYVEVLSAAAWGAAAPLGMALLVLSIGVLLLSFATFYAERGNWDDVLGLWINDAGDPSPFQDIGTSVYWAIITLSTVGYGDIFPVTGWGKLVGAGTALSGCIILAFPVAIYTDEFALQYSEFEKKKALQAELHGADLIMQLLRARVKQLLEPDWPRAPAPTTFREHRSTAQPRNLSLARWARERVSSGGVSARPDETAKVARSGSGRVAKHVDGATGDASAANDAAQFTTIWTTTAIMRDAGADVVPGPLRQRGRRGSVDVDAVQPEDEDVEGAAAPSHDRDAERRQRSATTTMQEELMSRLMQRMGASAPAVPTPESTPAPADVHRAAPVVSTTSAAHARVSALASTTRGEEEEASLERDGISADVGDAFRRLILKGIRALGDKRAPLRNGASAHADFVLSAQSFATEDFASDADVERAILHIVSDFRRRVWSEIRALEAKFRDDISIEIARRWQHWMTMPGDQVVRVAAPFVFRKRELRGSMGFHRTSLRVGIVDDSVSAPQLNLPPGSARSGDRSGGVMAGLRELFSGNTAALPALLQTSVAPALAAIPSRAAAVGKQLRAQLPLALQEAPDLHRNYRARIANQFTGILGEEAAIELASAPVLPPLRAQSSALMPSESQSSSSPSVQASGSTDTDAGGDRSARASAPAALADVPVASTTSHEWFMTPFGMSLLPRGLPTITSSLGLGTASITGAAASVPQDDAARSAAPGMRLPTFLRDLPTTSRRDELDTMFLPPSEPGPLK